MSNTTNTLHTSAQQTGTSGETSLHSVTSASGAPSGARSGAAMDRVVKKTPWYKKHAKSIAIAVVIATGAYWLYQNASERQMNVETERLVLASVSAGVFEDVIPVRGRVIPATTVFLDAVEGGRVERILVEDGTALEAGQLIVELSNPTLQLNVLGNEARVAEQLNNMRSIELSLEQNRLQHKRNLADIEYQIKMLERQLSREGDLLKTGAVVQSQYDDTRDTLDWYKTRRDLTLESQASDARMQENQLAFLKDTSQRLESNLAISRQNLDNMNVKAPVAGKLSGFDVEVGQSIGRGERLGQIDTPNDFKLTANIDEFYLDRIAPEQRATFDGYELTVSKIYPQVNNGQFEVDFKFKGDQPRSIRRGQSIQMELQLGDNTPALLIPNGSFYQDTGGQWVFVVSADGDTAVKRDVRLGRRNARYIEVLEGLNAGDTVITSPYTGFKQMDSLSLSE